MKFILYGFALVYCSLGYSGDKFTELLEDINKKFNAPQISHQKLDKLMKKQNVIILDTREKAEFDVSHIKGAIFVGYDDINLKKVISRVSKGSKVVLYCSVGYRSGDITMKLRSKGIDAYNLYGGLFLWNNIGNKLYTGEEKPTNQIHGYSKSWGKWLTSGEVVFK